MGGQMRLNLDKIKVDRGLFLRDEYDDDAVQRYKEQYKESGLKALPPLTVQKGTLLLIDGFHRRAALEMAGMGEALVEEIETDNPRMEAVRINAKHGVPLTKEERNKQIGELNREGLTQSEIGELFGLRQSRVSEILEMLGISETDKTNIPRILRERFTTNQTQAEIAKNYGIDRSRISQIEGDFRDELAGRFFSGESLEEISDWAKKKHGIKLSGEKLRKVLTSHKDVPKCLVENGNIELDGLRVEFRDALEALDEMENVADCIVTDPPYGIGFSSPRYRNKKFDVMEGDDDTTTTVKAIKKFGRVLKENSHAYVFTRWDVYPILAQEIPEELELVNLLVWDKGEGGHGMGDLGTFAPRYEMIMLLEKGRREINGKRTPNVLNFKDVRFTGEGKYHPTQKPVALIKSLIEKSTKEGELVLDPFLGSGTTAVAALSMNRSFLGFEIDRENSESIRRRIAKVIGSELQPKKA